MATPPQRFGMTPPPLELPPMLAAVPTGTPTMDPGPDKDLPPGVGYSGGTGAGLAVASKALHGWLAGRHVSELHALEKRKNEVVSGTASVNRAIADLNRVATDATLAQDPDKYQEEVKARKDMATKAATDYFAVLQPHVEEGMKKQKGVMGKLKGMVGSMFMPQLENIPVQAMEAYQQQTMDAIESASKGHASPKDLEDVLGYKNKVADQPAVDAERTARISKAEASTQGSEVAEQVARKQQEFSRIVSEGKPEAEQRAKYAELQALDGKLYNAPLEDAKDKLALQNTEIGREVAADSKLALSKFQRNDAAAKAGAPQEPMTAREFAALGTIPGYKPRAEDVWDAVQIQGGDALMEKVLTYNRKLAEASRSPRADNFNWELIEQQHPQKGPGGYEAQNPPLPGETEEQYQKRITSGINKVRTDSYLYRFHPTLDDRAAVKVVPLNQGERMDKVSNAIGNAIQYADPEEAKAFDTMIIRGGTAGNQRTMLRQYDSALKMAQDAAPSAWNPYNWISGKEGFDKEKFDRDFNALHRRVISSLSLLNKDMPANQMEQLRSVIDSGNYGAPDQPGDAPATNAAPAGAPTATPTTQDFEALRKSRQSSSTTTPTTKPGDSSSNIQMGEPPEGERVRGGFESAKHGKFTFVRGGWRNVDGTLKYTQPKVLDEQGNVVTTEELLAKERAQAGAAVQR